LSEHLCSIFLYDLLVQRIQTIKFGLCHFLLTSLQSQLVGWKEKVENKPTGGLADNKKQICLL
jgi:hypothetical protein